MSSGVGHPDPEQLSAAYVEALLDGEGHPAGAERIISQALAAGVPAVTVYVEVLPRALEEVGRRWQAGDISVADEHMATLVVQDGLRLLARSLQRAKPHGKTAVVAAVDGELHELGARTLADLLEADGWQVFYVGAATPTDALATLVDQRQPQVVALSATLSTHLPALAEAVARLRQAGAGSPFILIGGQACRETADLAKQLGADACHLRADEAVAALRSAL